MKKLELDQMENLEGSGPTVITHDINSGEGGGDFLMGCAGESVGLAFGFAGLVMGIASIIGAGFGAAGFIYASAQWGAACR